MTNGLSLLHPVAIGRLTVPGNLFLAPLAGFTDPAFRSVCVEAGADLTFTEMISAEGLARENEKTALLLERAPDEPLLAVQVFSGSLDSLERAIPFLISARPDCIDLNCGCPVAKVVKAGAGAALLKDPKLLYAMVKLLTEASSIPVSVKIRSGWDASSINYRETADAAEKAGAAMITLHARTRAQGYSGTADYSHISDLKTRISLPLFGSGDLFSARDAEKMLTETRADGVMFARGALGNPFIFRDARRLLGEGLPPVPTTPFERAAMLMTHLDRAVAAKGELPACREMRKQAGHYLKGFPGSSALRREIVRAETRKEYRQLLEFWLSPS